MERAIQDFVEYIHRTKHASPNTEISYRRDLNKLCRFLETEQEVHGWEQATSAHLTAYMRRMEEQSYAASSISRNVASMRTFFQYLLKQNRISENPAEDLRPPKAEKKIPEILSVQEVSSLLSQPDRKSGKGLRDAAMLELLYATGIRVSELIGLRMEDVNLKMDYILCSDRTKERAIPFGQAARRALSDYLETGRDRLISGADAGWLFVNCQGNQMSRQGFWKILKLYSHSAGITTEITPHTLRHSFAVHMIENGADLHAVQEMMGHSDISSTQFYLNMNLDRMRAVYDRAHPRG